MNLVVGLLYAFRTDTCTYQYHRDPLELDAVPSRLTWLCVCFGTVLVLRRYVHDHHDPHAIASLLLRSSVQLDFVVVGLLYPYFTFALVHTSTRC